MKRNHRAHKRAEINGHKLVVRLHIMRLDKLGPRNVGQQIEHLLNEVDDRMIDGQLAARHLAQIALNVGQLTA